MNLLEEHQKLVSLLDDATKLADRAIEVRKSKRRELDEFIKLHGDVIGKQKAAQMREAFANRVIAEKTPEEIEWFKNLKRKNNSNLEKFSGKFWETVQNGIPMPFPITIHMSSLHPKATTAHIAVDIGLFRSVTEARKAGHNNPIKPGEMKFKNGRFGIKRVLIIDDRTKSIDTEVRD